jgi:signal transduction histidine kinase
MYNRPHFKEYIMARLVTIAVTLFIVFSILLYMLSEQKTTALWAIFLLSLAFTLFIIAIYRGANRMQKELNTINNYLENLDEVDEIEYKARFFTQEFEDINQNLIKVLKKSKKREDTKQRYNAKLKLKNRQRADMLSAIAHEFRNPISSIMGYSQTLQDDPQISTPLREKFLGKIYNNGNKIESLLARLIMWNKFESKETTLHKSRFNIGTVIQEVKDTLEEKYKDREIEIIGSTREIEADRTLIEVVLKNLIENALKYSKDIVQIHINDKSIAVVDKGTGIVDKELDKVTKKFYRSDTHSWDNSMGLGLSIVKTILSLHKMKLEIESIEGEGSIFSFKI